MKIRKDFITNSSSSSFIVINTEDYDIDNLIISEHELEHFRNIGIFEYGKYQFGWEEEKSYDFKSKMNFLLILLGRLAEYLKDIKEDSSKKIEYEKDLKNLTEYRENLLQAVSDIGIEDIDWTKVLDRISYKHDDYAYIDHQSNILEHDYSMLLESVSNIQSFLFNEKSYIITSNDNDFHDSNSDEYCERYYDNKENCFTV